MLDKIIFPYSDKKLEKILKNFEGREIFDEKKELVAVAINFELKKRKNLLAYAKEIESLFVKAKSVGGKVIVFPELFYITPLTAGVFTKFLFKTPKKIKNPLLPLEERGILKEKVSLENLRILPNQDVSKTVLKVLKKLQRCNAFVLKLLKALAKKYKIYVSTGGGFCFFNGKLYNSQSLIGDKGEEIIRSKKTNPMEFELSLGVNYGDTVEVAQTKLGSLAIPICMDASYFEPFKIMAKKGCQIALIGTANLEPYHKELSSRGAALRANENAMYIVKSALVGYVNNCVMTGKAQIFAPSYVKGGMILEEAGTYIKEDMIYASLDLTKLKNTSPYFSDKIEKFDVVVKSI